jgi:hypothetical protein
MTGAHEAIWGRWYDLSAAIRCRQLHVQVRKVERNDRLGESTHTSTDTVAVLHDRQLFRFPADAYVHLSAIGNSAFVAAARNRRVLGDVAVLGYGVLSGLNPTSAAALALGSFAVASAIFLILQLSQPYTGLFRSPAASMQQTLAAALGSSPAEGRMATSVAR